MNERRFTRSASQFSIYQRCPKSFEYRYIRKIKFAAAWGIKGRALHAALAHHYGGQIETGVPPAADQTVQIFVAKVQHAFSAMAQTEEPVILFDGESAEQILTDGEAQLRCYLSTLAPDIKPVMVEERVEAVLPSGLPLVGILDLVDDTLAIRDAKFGVDPLREGALPYETQPPVYAWLFRQRMGEWPTAVVFDFVSRGRGKTPAPKAGSHRMPVTERLIEAWLADLETVDAQINAGYFPRRVSEQNCAKCVYRNTCWWGLLPEDQIARFKKVRI